MMVVPPVPTKTFRDRGKLSLLWRLALRELLFSDRWVIWGVSLAPTDFHLRWLLKEAASSREVETVIVINPDQKHRDRVKALRLCDAVTEYEDIQQYLENVGG